MRKDCRVYEAKNEMKRIIINADDFGLHKEGDLHIARFIEKGFVSSTSIVANGEDLEGVIQCGKSFPDISYGVHLNLTEGAPLTKSQLLLDMGFLKESNGKMLFNGRQFAREWLTKEARKDVFTELVAQVNRLRDLGIELSHMDSHHHIHTAYFMYPILPDLCDRVNLHKVRNIRNCYSRFSLTQNVRKLWELGIRVRNRKIQFPDMFCDLMTYAHVLEKNANAFLADEVVELECHPGNEKCRLEEEPLCERVQVEQWSQRRLVSYKKL